MGGWGHQQAPGSSCRYVHCGTGDQCWYRGPVFHVKRVTGFADIAWDEVFLTRSGFLCQSVRSCAVLTHETTGIGAVFRVNRGAQNFSAAIVPTPGTATINRDSREGSRSQVEYREMPANMVYGVVDCRYVYQTGPRRG